MPVRHGVLPVVADVGDAVGPADHLALGGGGGRAGPAVVGDPVEGLGAQVERGQRDVGPPRGVVEAPGTKGSRASSLAWPPGPWPQSWPRAMASVRATLSRQARAMPVATWATSRAWVRRVRWWSSGKTNTWVLPASRRNDGGVQDAVAVPLEAGAPRVGLLGAGPPPAPRGPGGPGASERRPPAPRGPRARGERRLGRAATRRRRRPAPASARPIARPPSRRGASRPVPNTPAMVAAQRACAPLAAVASVGSWRPVCPTL